MQCGIASALVLAASIGAADEVAVVDGDGVSALLPRSAALIHADRQALHAQGYAVLVDIWSTWCTACVAKLPAMVALAKRYEKERLRVLLVSTDGEAQRPAARRVLRKYGIARSYVRDEPEQQFMQGMDPQWSGTLPALLLFAPSGERRALWEGDTNEHVIEQTLSDLVGGSASQRHGGPGGDGREAAGPRGQGPEG